MEVKLSRKKYESPQMGTKGLGVVLQDATPMAGSMANELTVYNSKLSGSAQDFGVGYTKNWLEPF